MKKIGIFALILGIVGIIFASFSQGKVKSYYSGDALVFQNNLYVTSANTGSMEVFRLNNGHLDKVGKIKPFDQRFGKYDSFYDSHLREEDGTLYVYAVSGYNLYKYEVNSNGVALISSTSNSYWEWYNRVDEIGNHLATISEKGVKIWNNNLEVIDEYDFKNTKTPYNVRGTETFLFDIEDGNLSVFHRETRALLRNIPLNFKINPSAHNIYVDENEDIYVVDDYYAKKFSIDGKLLGSFKHLDYEGYDMTASGFSDYVYFSNGVGVVKLNKDTMKAVDWVWTGGLAGPQGWAMGLKSVYLNGDKVVVFNNANIVVLDSNLNKIASTVSEEEDESIYASESLFLNLDKNRGAANSEVSLSGGGFLPNEALKIQFDGMSSTVNANNRGRFNTILKTPDVKEGGYDIKVTGQTSKLTYSIAFMIE